MEKAYYETPGPSSDPKVPKKMMGHKNDSIWIGVTLTTGQCLTNSQDLCKLWTSRTVKS